jgi:hypothetical protein
MEAKQATKQARTSGAVVPERHHALLLRVPREDLAIDDAAAANKQAKVA